MPKKHKPIDLKKNIPLLIAIVLAVIAISIVYYSSNGRNIAGKAIGNVMTSEQFVKVMYKSLLGREATSAEINRNAGRLASGTSSKDIVQSIIATPEYSSKCRLRSTMLERLNNELGKPAGSTEINDLLKSTKSRADIVDVFTGTYTTLSAGSGQVANIIGSGADTDGDGLSDEEEKKFGSDPNNKDTDGDGLDDRGEYLYKSNPLKQDTDGDGLLDGEESKNEWGDITKYDTDGGGINDKVERDVGTNSWDPDDDKQARERTDDWDGDGLTNEAEEEFGSDPELADTDGDGLNDPEESIAETDPNKKDTDGDGLNDGDEVKIGTSPHYPDSDGDGLTDGIEYLELHTDPLKQDTDGDGLNDGDEVNKYKTDPLKKDTDGGGVSDGDEANRDKTDPLNPKDDIWKSTGGGSVEWAGQEDIEKEDFWKEITDELDK